MTGLEFLKKHPDGVGYQVRYLDKYGITVGTSFVKTLDGVPLEKIAKYPAAVVCHAKVGKWGKLEVTVHVGKVAKVFGSEQALRNGLWVR